MAAYVHCNFHSCILRMQVDVSILLPEKERMEDVEQGKKGETFGKNKKYQTLYLLHGFTGDHLTYLRTSKIERYADEHQIMVVMPSVYNSAYTDMKYGLDYFSYLTEELTDFVERNFPAATKRENRFIAGMSMGGFGTLKIALRYPERFLAACPIASAVQVTVPINGDLPVRKNLRQSEALRDLTMPNIVIRERLTRYPPFVKRYMVIRLRLHRRFMMFLHC